MKICYSLIALLLFPALIVHAQAQVKEVTPRFINGTVKNAVTGEAVPFASVMVIGATHGFSVYNSKILIQ